MKDGRSGPAPYRLTKKMTGDRTAPARPAIHSMEKSHVDGFIGRYPNLDNLLDFTHRSFIIMPIFKGRTNLAGRFLSEGVSILVAT
jgi:hypothetical protein